MKSCPECTGIRGCCGRTKRRGKERFCSQRAIVTRGRRSYCYYHDPENPKKFGQGYGSKPTTPPEARDE